MQGSKHAACFKKELRRAHNNVWTTANYKYGAQQEKSLHLVSSSVLAGLELNSITR